MAADGRLPLDKLSGAGAAEGDVPTWTGTRWKPGSGAVIIPVLHGDPSTLVEGLIWFDLDATC